MKEYFKNLEDEWVDFASQLIAAKALSGNEKGSADIFLNAMEEIGVESFRDECGNVVGVIHGNGCGPNVLLTGHMDVVPEGNLDAWGEFDPFKGTVKDGKLYGRGISDMLGGLSAEFFAFKEIKKAVDDGAQINGNLIFAAVVLEEPAECLGTIYLLEHTFPKHNLSADLVYLGEPSNGQLAIGQRGKVELVIEVFGKVAHSSAPQEGINAVEKAYPLLAAAFNNFGEEPVIHKIGKSSMVVTDIVVTPGKKYSCVPDYCEITIDRRYVPPVTTEDTVAQIQKVIDELSAKDSDFKAVVHPRINRRICYTGYETQGEKAHPCWFVDEANDYVKLTEKALSEAGIVPEKKYWSFGTDGSIICGKHNIVTIGYSGAHESQAHQPQEHVVIDEMLECIEGYTSILKKLYKI